jgi:hypothetical protein
MRRWPAGLQNMSTLGAVFDSTGKVIRPYTTADAYDLGPQSYVVTPQKRWVAECLRTLQLQRYATGYTEIHFSNNTANVQIAPAGAGANFLVNTNNPYLPRRCRKCCASGP